MRKRSLAATFIMVFMISLVMNQSLMSQTGKKGARAWPDTLVTITLEGTVLPDSTHKNLYFLDVDADSVADYVLHFGPEWYSPDTGAERPDYGDYITIFGSVNYESLLPTVIVFEINGLLWREPIENWWQHQIWCDSLEMITVEGTVMIDTTYFYDHYYLDIDADDIPDYLLNFGPPWYEPDTGAERPQDGDWVVIEGGLIENENVDMIIVISINDLAWRDRIGPAPWSGRWVRKQHQGKQRIGSPLDSLSWLEVPQGAMNGREFPDSLFFEFLEVWRDSIPNRPDSTLRGWNNHLTDPSGKRFQGQGNMARFGTRLRIQLSIDDDPSSALGKTTFYGNNVKVMSWDEEAETWSVIDEMVYDPIDGTVMIEVESLDSYYIIVGSDESATRVVLTDPVMPVLFELDQNYPNPFNPTTMIRYHLMDQASVTLTIYNSLGQIVRTLVDEVQPAGSHSVQWDATEASVNRVSSGHYYYELKVNDRTVSKRMLLLK
ncbi:T9SS type A sorting domain-containing protein [candidate division KSB1 bacterium]|nr:T9SS type A sorting domain-containing protein [candidate division KSB1 bacterium]